MSLKTFHIFFVTLSSLVCLVFALWCAKSHLATPSGATLSMGLVSGFAAVTLVVYGVRFLNKYKELSFL